MRRTDQARLRAHRPDEPGTLSGALRVMLLFGSSLILASSVGASRAQGQTSFLSNLTGRIIDSVSGNAVSGAAVTIAALNLETQSNSDGHFSIDAIGLEENPQAVDISVQADGYGEWRIEEVLLVDKDTLILNVEMGIDPVTITMPPPRTEAPGSYREAELGIALDAIEMDITEPALPETIIVRVYGPPYSPCNPSRTGYETQEIDFKEYVKHVLPNEWIYSWPGESLRAGAMAAKMYGWFWVDYPGSWDVRDDVCDQVYNPAVEYQSTNDAVDFTWNWRMLWGGDFKLIHYVDGIITTCDAQGWSYCIEQWGTYWHALGNNGYEKLTWDEMLEEYYDPQPSTYPLEITPVETPPLAGFMLRFYGNGWGDIDRVKIPIDPHVPLDIGDDFTLEWWMKADPAENGGASCTTGAHEDWIYGNTIFDRDVFGAGDYGEYGVSIAGERLAFGVNNGSASYTLCGGIPVADHSWHHVAVTRLDTGEMAIFVDGMMDAVGSGPPGEVSYRDARSSSYPTRDPYLVIGAEKHDEGTDYPSYSGFLDEIRMSDVVRYSARFTPPSGPFSNDDDTIAIYHFDEGRGDTLGDSAGSSDGQRRYGGFTNGPEWFVSDLLFLSPRIYLPLIIR